MRVPEDEDIEITAQMDSYSQTDPAVETTIDIHNYSDPLSNIGGQYIPSAFRRNLQYALRSMSSFLICYGCFYNFRWAGNLTYVSMVLSLFMVQQTLGETLIVVGSCIYFTTFACPLALLCGSCAEYPVLLVAVVFVSTVWIVQFKRFTALAKKLCCLVLLLGAYLPYISPPSSIPPWKLVLQSLPGLIMLVLFPCVSAALACLVPTPTSAIFRAKRRFKFMVACMSAATKSLLRGFCERKGADLHDSDVTQLVEQVDFSLVALSSLLPAVQAELIFAGADLAFADQLVHFIKVIREAHDVMLGMSRIARGITPNLTHEHFVQYLSEPMHELSDAVEGVLCFSYTATRHPRTSPLGAYRARRWGRDLKRQEHMGLYGWLKGLFMAETNTAVPSLGNYYKNNPFQKMCEASGRIRRVYHIARLRLLYGVEIDEPHPASPASPENQETNSQDQGPLRLYVTLADLSDTNTNVQSLVPSDAAVLTDNERLGWSNVLGRAAYVMELFHLVQTLQKLTHVVARAGSPEEIRRYPHTSGLIQLWNNFYEGYKFTVLSIPDMKTLVQPIKISATVTIASLMIVVPAFRDEFQNGLWAVLTICFLMSDSTASSFATGINRLEGTVHGAIYGYTVSTILGPNADEASIVISLALWILICCFSRSNPEKGYSSIVAAFTPIIILLGPVVPATAAFLRIVRTLYGILIYLVIDNLIFPSRSDTRLRVTVMEAVFRIRDFFKTLDIPEVQAVGDRLSTDDNSGQDVSMKLFPSPDRRIDDHLETKHPVSTAESAFVRQELKTLISEEENLLSLVPKEPPLWHKPFALTSYQEVVLQQRNICLEMMLLQGALKELPQDESKDLEFVRVILKSLQELRDSVYTAFSLLNYSNTLLIEGTQLVPLLRLRAEAERVQQFVDRQFQAHIRTHQHNPVLQDALILPLCSAVFSMRNMQGEVMAFAQALREVAQREQGAVYF